MSLLSIFGLDELVYEKRLLDQMEGYVKDGLDWVKREEAYAGEPDVVRCIEGAWASASSQTLSQLHDNVLRKGAYDVASALTDVRPIWHYTSNREEYKKQAETFSLAARYWWRSTHEDEPLLEAILNSMTGGAGYLWQRWNPELPGGGNMELVPLGVRDLMPIGPTFGKTVQEWQGCIIRMTVDMLGLCEQYPTKRKKIESSTGQWFDPPATRQPKAQVLTAFQVITRSVANSGTPGGTITRGTCDLMVAFMKDYSVNTGDKRVFMGKPDSWGYWVEPGERLYPRGRMVKFVTGTILEDGPCEYWHSQFPVTRVRLLPFAKTLLGLSLLRDVIPLNERYNEVLRVMDDGLGQHARRPIITNSSMAESKLKAIDSRAPGLKARINMTAGEKFEIGDGPDIPTWILQFAEMLRGSVENNIGSRGLRQLEQMKQMPSGDTIEKFMDSLSPLLRLMARQIEIALSEIAYQFLWNACQFYTTKRRFNMLGESGVAMEDGDWDPGTMIPASSPEEAQQDIEHRAADHLSNFVFAVAPNSFLNVSHTTKQLQSLQLFQRNALDPWTLWNDFDLVGVGKMPAETIAERLAEAKRQGIMPGPPPEVVQAQTQAMLMQLQMQITQIAMQLGMGGGMPPPGGAPGGGAPPGAQAPSNNGVGPQGGRPPTAQAPAHFEQKSDGRTVVSES
jgi:hypothetical protein